MMIWLPVIFSTVYLLCWGGVCSQELNARELLRKCSDGDVEAVQEFMAKYGVDAVIQNFKDIDNMSCLNLALTNKNTSLTWLLLQKGADPNGYTYITFTTYSGTFAHMEILIAYGAKADEDYSEALYRVAYKEPFGDEERKMMRLLLQNGADPTAERPGRYPRKSPFMSAVKNSNYGAIQEITKWMKDVPQVQESDIWQHTKEKYEKVLEAIQKGKEERKAILEFDNCRSNPCLNGGKCIDKFDDFACKCPTGYTGSTCLRMEEFGKCSENPCQQNEECIQLNWFKYSCSGCDEHWVSGSNTNGCEEYSNPKNKWCKKDGDHYGDNWKKRWGKFEDWADSLGRTALVCPQCGCVPAAGTGLIEPAEVELGIRLINLNGESEIKSSSTIRGRTEIFQDGEWQKLCHITAQDPYATDKLAEVVCRMMGKTGYSDAVEHRFYAKADESGVSKYEFLCKGDEKTIFDCPKQEGKCPKTKVWPDPRAKAEAKEGIQWVAHVCYY